MEAHAIARLRAASADPTVVYALSEYHWLLLYECLSTFCAVHNDDAADVPAGGVPVGPYTIGESDFGLVEDHYSWDTDFLVDAATAFGVRSCSAASSGVG